MRPTLSVVIPVYNSEDNLIPLHAALTEALGSFTYEVVLVDDRSRDASWHRIESLVARDPRVIGVRLRRNYGQDGAIMAGLHHARGEYVVIMDDDLQHHPRDIPALYAEVVKGYDVCFADFPRKLQTPVKNFGSWLGGKVAEIVLRKPPHIYMSPFKIIQGDVVEELVRYRGPYPFVDGLLFQVTDSVTQVPIEHHPRHAGRSSTRLRKQIVVFATLATAFSLAPLRVVTVAGFAVSLLSFLLGIFFLVLYFTQGTGVYGWTSIALMNLFLGGAILTALGITGEYVGRVLMNVNALPQFTVEQRIPPRPPPGRAPGSAPAPEGDAGNPAPR
ncbi:MAG TPA: glycosyltransferase family 2 protein [Methylomirabilota bacterium]|jgi:undecaprenyl-phosphate 4-deoxy-4-formamido-L-arabinose transferase|nr:glycosyltransferase family 2 protein [Methylomirabilota bacterium]